MFFEYDKCCVKQEHLFRNLEYEENVLSFKYDKNMIMSNISFVVINILVSNADGSTSLKLILLAINRVQFNNL